mgnify:FL=1|tara:strand:+ start:11526 stop:13283 length:1758 start_codon:yes stop_codon:yes gene_type:complete
MAKGFGKMDVGLVNQVNKVNKNYDSEILATGVNSFMSAAKPVVESFAEVQGKFDKIMESFTDASQIPTASAEERSMLQPIVDATSTEAQKHALAYAENPSDLEAQAGFNKAIAKMNQVTAGQTELYKNKAEAKVNYDNHSYSSGQLPSEKQDAMQILGGSGFTESYDENGYKTYKMDNGTIYDNNPNTEYSEIPKVQGEFKEGRTAMFTAWNENTKVNGNANISKSLKNFSVDGTANSIYSSIMSSGTKADGTTGRAPTYGEQVDLLFGDISGDEMAGSYADMWLKGSLDPSYYQDANGNEITDERGVPFSNLELDKRESLLRNRTRLPNNMKNLSRFYANTIKSGLEQKQITAAEEENVLLMTPGTEGKFETFKNETEANEAKLNLYTDKTMESLIPSGFSTDENIVQKLENAFKNDKLVVEGTLISAEGEDDKYGISIIPTRGLDGDKVGAQELIYDPNNANDMRELRNYLRENSSTLKNMEKLGGFPSEWVGLDGELMYAPIGDSESAYSQTEPYLPSEIEDDGKFKDPSNEQVLPDYLKGRDAKTTQTVVPEINTNVNVDEIMADNDANNPYSVNYTPPLN